MTDATYVLFAPKAQLARLRAHLKTLTWDEVRWRERRRLFGSEFYVSGPSRQAREAHQSAALCLTRSDGLA
jgi:hypothetical protein